MIDEKTLTFYYFEDGLSPDERQQVEDALARDRLLAARYQALKAELDDLQSAQVIEAPDHLKHQWHDLVAREAQLERQRQAPQKRPIAWFGLSAALTAVLALGVAIGLFMTPNRTVPGSQTVANNDVQNPTTDPAQQPPVFQRGLQAYLADSQRQLSSMDNRSSDEQSLLVMQIVAQNRLFEHAADQQDAPEVARLMRAIEPILLRLAEADTTTGDADALRRQLTFELNAVLTKLEQPASKEAPTI